MNDVHQGEFSEQERETSLHPREKPDSQVTPGQRLGSSTRETKGQMVAQEVKNLLVIQETGVRSLGRDDPLEEETTTHSSFLAWEISRAEEPGGLQSMGLQELDLTERLNHHPEKGDVRSEMGNSALKVKEKKWWCDQL